MKEVIIYSSGERGNNYKQCFPIKCTIDSLESLLDAIKNDTASGRFKNDYKIQKNFEWGICIPWDVDNSHCDDKSSWKTIEDIKRAYPDTAFYYWSSKSHMKVKDGKEARPKYHGFFILSKPIYSDVEYKAIQSKVGALFPFFDQAMQGSQQPFTGVENPTDYGYVEGVCIDEFLNSFTTEDLEARIKQSIDDYESHTGWKPVNSWRKAAYKPKPRECSGDGSLEESAADFEKIAEEYGINILSTENGVSNDGNPSVNYYIDCIWEEEHSCSTGMKQTRVVIYSDGRKDYQCLHDHCRGRKWVDVCKKLGIRYGETSVEEAFGSIGKMEDKRDDLLSALKPMTEFEEREAEWLVPGYIPKGQITVIGGDGGTGKTTIWCDIAAAVSSGRSSFFEYRNPRDRDPQKVLFFSSEDDIRTVILRRLRKSGAKMENVFSIQIGSDIFHKIKFNSSELDKILECSRPALVIFDPIQSFLPQGTRMAERGDMRSALDHLSKCGDRYGCSFLIISHTNKRGGVSGRDRLSDSSDIWDHARSVMLVGRTEEPSKFYCSQEKSNYGPLSDTVIYSLGDGSVRYLGPTDKKDRDFVQARAQDSAKPKMETAKEFILKCLEDGMPHKSSEIDENALAVGIARATLGTAKTHLINANKIKSTHEGSGRGSAWYLQLCMRSDKKQEV